MQQRNELHRLTERVKLPPASQAAASLLQRAFYLHGNTRRGTHMLPLKRCVDRGGRETEVEEEEALDRPRRD